MIILCFKNKVFVSTSIVRNSRLYIQETLYPCSSSTSFKSIQPHIFLHSTRKDCLCRNPNPSKEKKINRLEHHVQLLGYLAFLWPSSLHPGICLLPQCNVLQRLWRLDQASTAYPYRELRQMPTDECICPYVSREIYQRLSS